MRIKVEGNSTLCFYKRQNPAGVLRMSSLLLDATTPSSKQMIETTLDKLKEDENDQYEKIGFNDFSGIYYMRQKQFNPIDSLYWGTRQIDKYKDKLPKTEIEWALSVFNLTKMTMHYWELGNDKVHFWFSYRHFFSQDKDSDQILQIEIAKVNEIFSTIKMHDCNG
jgi:hypothetical protein